MPTNIISSVELMSNYMQGEIVSPSEEFTVLQTEGGYSLLFSIGTDGIFYLTEEVSSSGTGWQKHDLSSGLVNHFPEGSTFIAKTFAVNQNTIDNKFSIALAVTAADDDYLFVAENYTTDENGFNTLNWKPIPFDWAGKVDTKLNISDIYILQTASAPLIVVDTIPSGSSTFQRYYIDSNKTISDFYWNPFNLPVNMSPDSASICGGRKAGEYVNGIYSLGVVGSEPALFYQQVYDPFNPSATGSAGQLVVEGGSPEAMASTVSAVVKSDDESIYTDLYVSTSEGYLCLFTADNQKNDARGLAIMQNDLFKSAVNLYAYTILDQVVVWGLNRSQQVFYTECNISAVADPSAWSYPVPIASKVVQISPYKNRINGGNTFFLHTGTNSMKKAVQDPVSTSWITQDILLPVDVNEKAQKCDCYMTRFTACDENNSVLANTSFNLSSAYRIPVYINDRYYVLDRAPISVTTDSEGAIKVVQRVDNLQGARLLIQSEDGEAAIVVNPMNAAVAKIATLNTADALSEAYIRDDKGAQIKPLVNQDISDNDLDNAAASINSLIEAYNNCNNESFGSEKVASETYRKSNFSVSPSAKVYTLVVRQSMMQDSVVEDVGDTLSDIGDAIVVAAGDLCSWLRDATEYIIQIIEDTAQKVWHFVVTVGGQVLTFIIDMVEKAIAALVAVFDLLKTLIKDLIQFLKFLFSWDDISRTNDVFVNMITLYLNYGVAQIPKVKGKVNDMIGSMIDDINQWADLPSIPEGEYASQPLYYGQSQTDNSSLYTAPNTYLQDHFTNNVANASFLGSDDGMKGVLSETVIASVKVLLDALKKESGVLKKVYDVLYSQLFKDDAYKTMSLADILKTILALLADAVLASSAVVIDAFIDFVVIIFEAIVAIFTQPVWIPVVSDILEEIFGYELKFSLLDIICLIGSIPSTLIYKITKGEAPFTEDDGFSEKIIQANSLEDLMTAFGQREEVDYSKQFDSLFALPQSAKEIIFVTSHYISCVAVIAKAPLIVLEDALEAPYVPVVSRAKTICNSVGSLSYAVAGLFAQPYPLQDESASKLSSALDFCSFSLGVALSVTPSFIKSEQAETGISVIGAVLDIIINLTSIAPVACHFSELAAVSSEDNSFRTLAILDDTVKLTNYLSNIANDGSKFDPEALTSTAIAVTSAGLALLDGGLQFSECYVGD